MHSGQQTISQDTRMFWACNSDLVEPTRLRCFNYSQYVLGYYNNRYKSTKQGLVGVALVRGHSTQTLNAVVRTTLLRV